ncbi:hypothetical protein GF345_01175 [Candidatus Woesearchaeota archaeon]|nr:hypothetical protein [Candidatus Woesearchaeota archaeon]
MPTTKVEELKSPSTYKASIAYVPSMSSEYGFTRFNDSSDRAITRDGWTFMLDGTDIVLKDNNGRDMHMAIVSELLNPDKSLDDHENGVSYRIVSTHKESLFRKVQNGAYSILHALKNGHSKEGYTPLDNLIDTLPPSERVPDIDSLIDKYGLFEVAYSVTGECWNAQRREAIETQLLKTGMKKDNVENALGIYDTFIGLKSKFEGSPVISVLAEPEMLQKELKEAADADITYLLFSEILMRGGKEGYVPLGKVYAKLQGLGLKDYTVKYRDKKERITDTQIAIESRKSRKGELSDLLEEDMSSEDKVKGILERSSHDIRLHTEYLNPFENFYIIAPEELAVDVLSDMTEKEFNEAYAQGRFTDVHAKVFEAIQQIRIAGAMKVRRDSEHSDPFRPDDSEPKESELTFVGRTRYDEQGLLEMFYQASGLNPDMYPVYVAAVRNPGFTMEELMDMYTLRDEHYVDEAINAKVRSMKNKELGEPSDNMKNRIKLHALWELPAYNRLCKDLVAKAIEFAADNKFSYREQIWFKHYGDAIKEKFPEILYGFMEQLLLEKTKKETGGAPLLEHIVELYEDILYYGLGMDKQGATDGRPVNRRKDFAEAYITAVFSQDQKLVGTNLVDQEFVDNVMQEDAKWLDELAERGITTQLDSLLFKYLYPDVFGLGKDVKKLIDDMACVDVIRNVLTRMNASGELCSEGEFNDLYRSKQDLDDIDPELFGSILPQVISFSRSRGELAGEFERYIGDVYEKMQETMARYSGEPDEIITAIENDFKDLMGGHEKEKMIKQRLAKMASAMSQQLSIPGNMTDEETADLPLRAYELPDMAKMMADMIPKFVMSHPEIRAHYIYNRLKEEVDSIPKPEDDDTDISIDGSDKF